MLQRYFEKPLFRDAAFFVLLLFVMGVMSWDSALNRLPSEPHLWRQSDCISLTMYYAKGASFFEPEMHARISDDGRTGQTVAEFPLIYYIVGKIWSVTGVQLWVYRLFGGLLCMVAMLCLYRILLRLTGKWFWSALGPLLLMASPIYSFYGISFLTNVPALNCIIIAWYFIVRYYDEQKLKQLIYASVFFSLAGLLKISSMTSYLLLLFIAGLELVRLVKFKKEGKIFPKPFIAAGILLFPLVITLLWNLGFVEWYCNMHWGRYSFSEPVPVWTYDATAKAYIWQQWFTFTMYQVYPPHVWFFFLGAVLFLLTQFRKINPVWIILMPLSFIGHAMFSLLFFFCLDGHDYYHIDLLFFFLVTYTALVKYISQREENVLQTRTLRVFAAVLMTWTLLGTATNINARYFGTYGARARSEIFLNRSSIDLFNELHDSDWLRRAYGLVANELDRRGYTDSTVVIVGNDVSFNSLLARLDKPGYSAMADWQMDSASTAWRIERGAELLIIEEPESVTAGVNKFMGYLLFRAKHVYVYDLKPYRQ